jgi:hypothetical protein
VGAHNGSSQGALRELVAVAGISTPFFHWDEAAAPTKQHKGAVTTATNKGAVSTATWARQAANDARQWASQTGTTLACPSMGMTPRRLTWTHDLAEGENKQEQMCSHWGGKEDVARTTPEPPHLQRKLRSCRSGRRQTKETTKWGKNTRSPEQMSDENPRLTQDWRPP